MQNFKIGQPVVISHTTNMSYCGDDREYMERCAYAYPLTETRKGVIIGIKSCPLGRFYPNQNSSRGGRYESNGSIQLWEVKIGLRNKVVFVQDRHAIACDEFELPSMARTLRVGGCDSETTAADLGWAPRRTLRDYRRIASRRSVGVDVGNGLVAVDFETTGPIASHGPVAVVDELSPRRAIPESVQNDIRAYMQGRAEQQRAAARTIPDAWAYEAARYLNSSTMATHAIRQFGEQSNDLLAT